MPRLLFVALALGSLAGCTRPTAPPPAAVMTADCDASGVQSYIGRDWRVTLNDELRRASKSGVVRVMWAGEPITLELSPSRLNVVLDKQNTIEQLYCG